MKLNITKTKTLQHGRCLCCCHCRYSCDSKLRFLYYFQSICFIHLCKVQKSNAIENGIKKRKYNDVVQIGKLAKLDETYMAKCANIHTCI